MKALQGRKDLHKAIKQEYETLRNYTAPDSSMLSFEHHARKIHCLAFKCLLNEQVL